MHSWFKTSIILGVFAHSLNAFASALPIDPSSFSTTNATIDSSIANPIIKTIALVSEHRPMDPATPLGTMLGLDLGLAIAATKIPDDFWSGVKELGVKDPGAAGGLAIPIPRVMLHKGFGSSFGIGASALAYKNYHIYGGDAKWAFYQDDEGPTYAARLCYTTVKIGVFETTTWSPQILASKKMTFADPYIGIGYSMISGKIDIPISIPAIGQSIHVTGEGRGSAISAFTGVRFGFDLIGLELTLEGSYSTAGADSLGFKFGFAF